MKETIILLYFLQADYGRRLLRFLTRKKNKQIRLELMTERERVMWRTETENQRIVVLTDDEGLYAEAKKEVILLGKADDRQQKKILQYQRAEGIYEDLLKILGYKPLEEQKKIQKGVIMFFSPEGMIVTEPAVMTAQYLGTKGRCLFVSLSGFPVYFDGEFSKDPHWQKRDIGELLLCPSEKLFSAQLPQYVYPFGSADMLTPFAHYKDLLDCGIEDLKKLFERLLTIGEYDSLVVEMGALSESLMEFMVCADRLFVVDKRDGFGDVRKKVFLHYCEMEKKNDLFCSLKKIHHLCSDLHLKQASRLANYSLRAFFMSIAHDIVPTPVWSVNAPTACFRWRSTGKRNFFVPFPYLINILFHFK